MKCAAAHNQLLQNADASYFAKDCLLTRLSLAQLLLATGATRQVVEFT